MKEVTLKIIGIQTTSDGEEDTMELTTRGKFYEKLGSYFIVYDESEISGMEGATTTLKIQGRKVLMKRFGTSNSSMIFERGKKHTCEYATPYGNMDMDVVTNHIDVDVNENGTGKIEIKYKLNIMGSEVNNKLSVDIM
ncbi:calycin-like domain-containing protein [Gottschalkia acidurici 9a]|uniref:Calycin-like domain-containing protein n=1 Tax=Gottschalkia acidurici (strain ATCC 7906 / DSM 604 / BCRC 14475 / CIP 104303 / KCTC 5404 / NCIMB 10678 / 9a) TaxID=1128398 RepID=K0AWT8_GOTA9|nr:DUF1934 domain-containing protein [Gottschalkia acidurici]AFS77242.1 calycin-like domain-containing protein [Gottschalkia acidurici 9a]